MTYNRLPDNTPAILRKYGLKVVVVPGWKARGRPASTGGLNPVGVLCHHTATAATSSVAAVLSLLVHGRSDLPGPLCHFALGRDGTVYVVASGRANHAGEAKASGSVASGDGNELYWGIEAMNNGVGELWPDAQYKAYVLLCAVLSKEFTHNSFMSVRGHKETSVTGKIDPLFDMTVFRNRVNNQMMSLHVVTPTRPTRGKNVDAAIEALQKARGKGVRAKQIQAALVALKAIKPAERVVAH